MGVEGCGNGCLGAAIGEIDLREHLRIRVGAQGGERGGDVGIVFGEQAFADAHGAAAHARVTVIQIGEQHVFGQ